MTPTLSRLTSVSWRPWRTDREVVIECRDCGTKVTRSTDVCPACGSSEIARYSL